MGAYDVITMSHKILRNQVQLRNQIQLRNQYQTPNHIIIVIFFVPLYQQ